MGQRNSGFHQFCSSEMSLEVTLWVIIFLMFVKWWSVIPFVSLGFLWLLINLLSVPPIKTINVFIHYQSLSLPLDYFSRYGWDDVAGNVHSFCGPLTFLLVRYNQKVRSYLFNSVDLIDNLCLCVDAGISISLFSEKGSLPQHPQAHILRAPIFFEKEIQSHVIIILSYTLLMPAHSHF